MSFEKIFDHIYFLKGVGSCNIYLLDYDKKILVDTGHVSTQNLLLTSLWQIGFGPENLDYIFCTHSHGDHVGNTALLKKQNPRIKIIGSARYEEYQYSRRVYKVLDGAEDDFTDYKLDYQLKENDAIELFNNRILIYETPGHTRDSIVFYLQNEKILITGDIIYNGIITQLDYYQSIVISHQELIHTYEKIGQIPALFYLPGHGSFFNNPLTVVAQCKKKLDRLIRQPEMLLINNLVPSAEFYIHKNPGLNKQQIIDYFIKNMLKFKNDPLLEKMETDDFIILMEKLLSLMNLINMTREEQGKIYLKNNLINI